MIIITEIEKIIEKTENQFISFLEKTYIVDISSHTSLQQVINKFNTLFTVEKNLSHRKYGQLLRDTFKNVESFKKDGITIFYLKDNTINDVSRNQTTNEIKNNKNKRVNTSLLGNIHNFLLSVTASKNLMMFFFSSTITYLFIKFLEVYK